MSPQLSTSMLVESALALANAGMVTAVLERRGHPDSGAILVRLDQPDGTCRLESRVVDFDGKYTWQDVTGPAALSSEQAQERITREKGYDPDLWVIAVDATLGQNPFEKL